MGLVHELIEGRKNVQKCPALAIFLKSAVAKLFGRESIKHNVAIFNLKTITLSTGLFLSLCTLYEKHHNSFISPWNCLNFWYVTF